MGSCAPNPTENAKTVKEHFQKVYTIQNQLESKVLDLVRQRPISFELDDPTLEEVRKAVNSAKKRQSCRGPKILGCMHKNSEIFGNSENSSEIPTTFVPKIVPKFAISFVLLRS